MSHVIALQGSGSSGKTSTLLQVFSDLQAKYPNSTVQHLAGRTDIKVLMRGVNGKTVGIETQGDPNSRLQQSLPYFIAAKCDIIFCACRTSGMTVTWVNALSPKHKVQFVQQNRVVHGYAKANAAMATYLIRTAGL
jgi:Ni2+-binding GTPase involved in maturation of urease and hydrogenase